jgi:hypothetical protein
MVYAYKLLVLAQDQGSRVSEEKTVYDADGTPAHKPSTRFRARVPQI